MEWAIPHTQNFFIFNVYKKHLFYTLPIEEYLIKTFNIFINKTIQLPSSVLPITNQIHKIYKKAKKKNKKTRKLANQTFVISTFPPSKESH